MARFSRKVKPDPWAPTVALLTEREAKVRKLQAEGTPDARRQLKKMRDVMYDTDPAAPSAGLAWNPDGREYMRGSSAKCDRINSGYNAKGKIPCHG